jgi:hypothetical protein
MSINTDRLTQFAMGQHGSEIVTGTGAGAAGPWSAIAMVAETTFSALTMSGGTGTFTGVAFPAGFVLYGPITAFTLTSGTCVAVKGAMTA